MNILTPQMQGEIDTAKGFLNEYLRFDNTSIFCFFDLETEGLNLFYSRAWQAAYKMVQGDKILNGRDMYIYWKDLQVSPEAARITGYDAAKVKRLGLTPDEALDILEARFREADFIIGHNVIFYDYYIYRAWCRYLKRVPMDLTDKLLDTFLFAKAIKLGIPFRPDVDRFSFFMKLYSEIVKRLGCSLGVLAKEYKCPVDESRLHDAGYDLEMNVCVWTKTKWSIPV